ncbi:MAG TPA: Dabb family protein [Pirellulales bacterium]|nr:Dabb family protein [Pirellulales bacterium]
MSDWRIWIGSVGGLLSVSALVALAASGARAGAANEPPRKVLRHVVLYKFKESVTPKEVEEVIAAFNALPGKIPFIVGYEHGLNLSQEGKSDGLTHCFMVSFANEKDRDAYIAHPAHQDYVKVVRDRREKVVVVDFWSAE